MELHIVLEQVKKKAKVRNRYNQVPHLIQDTVWYGKVTKTHENITYKGAKRSALSQQVTMWLQEIDVKGRTH